MSRGAIGFFDSGVGGLSVLRAVVELLPNEDTDYIADSANCPYGGRPAAEIRELSMLHAETLIARGAKMVVVACNTATAAAVDVLRAAWPDVPFVGMEPAVKPAAMQSRSGTVAVLATEGTFKGRLWRETSARCASHVRIVKCIADEFVGFVERGELDGAAVEAAVRERVVPLIAKGADHIVLGCTHFPFLKPVIERIAAGRAKVIDPSPAVARRVKSVLEERGLANDSVDVRAFHRFETTSAGGKLNPSLYL